MVPYTAEKDCRYAASFAAAAAAVTHRLQGLGGEGGAGGGGGPPVGPETAPESVRVEPWLMVLNQHVPAAPAAPVAAAAATLALGRLSSPAAPDGATGSYEKYWQPLLFHVAFEHCSQQSPALAPGAEPMDGPCPCP